MLSRLLNISVICLILLGVLDQSKIESLILIYIGAGFLSCIFTPIMMTRIQREQACHSGMIPIAELDPGSREYGERCLIARVIPLILLICCLHAGSRFAWLVAIQYFFLEYYIYQVRLFNTICMDILEKRFS